MAKVKLATIQLNSSDDLDENLNQVKSWIEQASDQGAQLVALPENFAYMGRESEKIQNLSKIQNTTEDFLQKISKQYRIYILAGGYPSLSPESQKSYNTASLYSPNGDKIFQYNKIHLFDTNPGDGIEYKESRTVFSGDKIPEVIDVPMIGRISSVICYDLRFPELFRKISEQNAQIIFVPAAFTELTGKAHWEVLLRARAIENFVFIIAPGQTGTHNLKSTQATKLKQTYGHSMVISPWGEVLLDAGDKVGCNVIEIDLEDIELYRNKIPSLNHRKIK